MTSRTRRTTTRTTRRSRTSETGRSSPTRRTTSTPPTTRSGPATTRATTTPSVAAGAPQSATPHRARQSRSRASRPATRPPSGRAGQATVAYDQADDGCGPPGYDDTGAFAVTHSPGADWEAPKLLSSAGCTPVVAYDGHGTAYAAWAEPAFDTTTTSASAANATSIDVASTAGISPGVDVAIEPVTSSTGERATVASVSGSTVTFTAPLGSAHAAGVQVAGTVLDHVGIGHRAAGAGGWTHDGSLAAHGPIPQNLTSARPTIAIAMDAAGDG